MKRQLGDYRQVEVRRQEVDRIASMQFDQIDQKGEINYKSVVSLNVVSLVH